MNVVVTRDDGDEVCEEPDPGSCFWRRLRRLNRAYYSFCRGRRRVSGTCALAARRCLGTGGGAFLLSGGYGLDEELERAGAYRVYEDPADMLDHLDEVGGRR